MWFGWSNDINLHRLLHDVTLLDVSTRMGDPRGKTMQHTSGLCTDPL
jgi:hypothetical protein